jgi:catalase
MRAVGEGGPAPLESCQSIEKITHFDREHPRAGDARARRRRARLFRGLRQDRRRTGNQIHARQGLIEAGKKTPIFVRFSTAIGVSGEPQRPAAQ